MPRGQVGGEHCGVDRDALAVVDDGVDLDRRKCRGDIVGVAAGPAALQRQELRSRELAKRMCF
jgi:hypothetical protein